MTQELKFYSNLLPDKISGLSIADALKKLAAEFPGKVAFSTSFSWEDQAITHIILTNNIPIEIFTLDTGRLFDETYYVWSRTNEKYNTRIKAYYPQAEELQEYIGENGPNAFYESVQLRKTCCYIRKVEPLKRALAGNELWITGLRSEHSPERKNLPQVEWDEANQIIKYHPILDWTTEELTTFIYSNHIPYNTLHNKGFVSIGCAPCTRAIKAGEDFRAGRWWWENKDSKECGLHVHS
ncbi:MAG TPA: phosphoadenylyl-sulfate reductase [Chitinophagaceae bacterium]|nr:phosphoadenylyl-sulfate reductase [Chitinophagaceae bacterium]